MQLGSFREVLLKKSEGVGNKNLSTLIEYMGDEIFVSHVLEALEKMARPTNNMGSKLSAPLSTYAANLDRSDVAQLRDALSHHVSHYKAALKQMHQLPENAPERYKMRQVADQHLNHLVPLLHLASQVDRNSNGKLAVDTPPIMPWEVNYTTLDRRPETGRFVHDAKGLRRRPAAGARQWSNENPNARGVKDYHYLEMAPHPGHEDYANMPHEGGYPWEEIQLGAPADVDAKKAYLHIEDIPDKKEYTPHPFDSHPIRAVQDIQADHFSPERLDRFAQDFAAWKGSEPHKQWLESQKAAYQKDPEGYKARGSVKPAHVYEGMPLIEQLGHVQQHPRREKKVPQAGAPAATGATRATTPTSSARPGMTIRKPATSVTPAAPAQPAAGAPHPMEEAYQHYLKASDPVKKIFHANPEFMQYLATKTHTDAFPKE